MSRKATRSAERRASGAAVPSFTPVRIRARHDGWTPERQVEFIEALAESGCVDEACGRVGMSASSAYALRRRLDAASFRQAWDIALDYAIRRLSDAVFARALHGVARPVFFQGEQVGERRYYDERLAMFLLRYRDPVRYGAWRDGTIAEQHPEAPAIILSKAVNRLEEDAADLAAGRAPAERPPLAKVRVVRPDEDPDHDPDYYKRATEEELIAELRKLDVPGMPDWDAEGDCEGDVA